MLSGFGLNLKGSISAPLGERKMCKGLKKKKQKKTRPTNMHIHQTHCQTARFCQGINLQDLQSFSETNFKDFSRTQIEPYKPFHS